MSEYQYYEFQALDRPLGEADLKALRALSSRARITATSFTNTYEWGDFKGSPDELMKRWFDLHLYFANWGTRRLMIRFPARLIDRRRLENMVSGVECAEFKVSGESLVLDLVREELEIEDGWDDGSGWLAALAPLRADVLGADLRLFYLLWLIAVENDDIRANAKEPLPGIGPLSGALDAFARFFCIDKDLVAAASERSGVSSAALAPDAVQRVVASLPGVEKNGLLARLALGDAHVASEVKALLRSRLESAGSPAATLRTAGELRARAQAIRQAREREESERLAAERKRREAEQERARRITLDAIHGRGDAVWREIEAEIERGNPTGYNKAAGLLTDLKTIAGEQGTEEVFNRRLRAIRERHARKGRFIERLKALG